MEQFRQVSWFVVEGEDADALGAQFGDFFAVGIEVVAPISAERIAREQYGEIFSANQSDTSFVRFYLPVSIAETEVEQYFVDLFGAERVAQSLQVELYEMPDFEQQWRDSVVDIPLGNITIVPPWRATASVEQVRIVLEPKMAFGTGDHATTQLAASLLAELDLVGKRVLDVGTGSGILAMFAARNQAKFVLATEIDRQAVLEARENVVANDLADVVQVIHASAVPQEERFDVIIANITLPILTELLPQMIGLAPVIVISGIMMQEQEQIERLVQGLGLVIDKLVIDGEWLALQIG
ncbi:50S ribosomal protein L11 methyltransferase [Culicoidibacter larvae]|uniref:Methyltransferase n=1 Tax=Culicoidibacter larvae TaxID=2579976 RepID=A0A5R8QD44_9FIRM|nr:50S ribosomal protein L11 methyltransferase [Culicoidibacter larvae]TLG73903.1 methyltransferase [Culicoidibacter larvae]